MTPMEALMAYMRDHVAPLLDSRDQAPTVPGRARCPRCGFSARLRRTGALVTHGACPSGIYPRG